MTTNYDVPVYRTGKSADLLTPSEPDADSSAPGGNIGIYQAEVRQLSHA